MSPSLQAHLLAVIKSEVKKKLGFTEVKGAVLWEGLFGVHQLLVRDASQWNFGSLLQQRFLLRYQLWTRVTCSAQ